MPKLTIVFVDAGGGHRNAARALERLIEQQGRPWRVDLLNLQELLDTIDLLRKVGRIRVQDAYNLMLRKGWTRFTPQMLRGLQTAIRLWHGPMVRLLERHWRQSRPDLVLSVMPNFNRALAESLRRALPGTIFVTLLTDLADYPPHFWIERESEYVICGSERAREQAIGIGVRPERCFLVSGMLLNPRVYDPRVYQAPVLDRAGDWSAEDRRAERERLGLRPDLATALVLFGGEGSPAMLRIARELQASATPLQMILICGRNERLASRIRRIPAAKPMLVEGFTDKVGYYMSLSDFLIGKPGPGSISEALHFNLPVVVEENARTLPQERYNAEWIQENEFGVVLKDFREIDAAVRDLLCDGKLTRLRARAAAHENRAVFEAVDILACLLDAASPVKDAGGSQLP